MPIKWTEVLQKPAYETASKEVRKKIQEEYFRDVVVPNTDESEQEQTRKDFYKHVKEVEPLLPHSEPVRRKKMATQAAYDPSMGLSPAVGQAGRMMTQEPELQMKPKRKSTREKRAEDDTYTVGARYYDEGTQAAAVYQGNGNWERLKPKKYKSKDAEYIMYADEAETMPSYERSGKKLERFTPTAKIDKATGAIDETWTHPAEMGVGLTLGAVLAPARGIAGPLRNVLGEFTVGTSELGMAATRIAGRKAIGAVAKKPLTGFSEGMEEVITKSLKEAGKEIPAKQIAKKATESVKEKVKKSWSWRRSQKVKHTMYDDMLAEASDIEKSALKNELDSVKIQDAEISSAQKFNFKKFREKAGVYIWDDKANVRKALDDVTKRGKQLIKKGKLNKDQIAEVEAIMRSTESAVERRILQHGASHQTLEMMKKVDKEVFKDLSATEGAILGDVRKALRDVEIAGRETKKGVVKVSGDVEGKKIFLKKLKEKDPQLYEKLIRKNEQLQEVFTNQLKQLRDEGILSQKSFDDMIAKGEHYNPRLVLEKIDPLTQGKYGKVGAQSNMAYLETGTGKTLMKDPRYLVNDYIGKAQSMIFRNRANKALYELAETAPDLGIVRKMKKGMKASSSEEIVKAKIDGKEVKMLMPKGIADEWKGLDPLMKQEHLDALSMVSGTKILKAFATGVNPFFAVRNLFRDMQYIYASPRYSAFIPKFAGQIMRDYAATVKNAITNKGMAQKYIELGGGFGSEGLTRAGRLREAGTLGTKKMRKTLDFLGGLGEISERWSRLAHARRAMRNGHSMESSVFIARDALDFGQGGLAGKAANSVLPYFNVGIQGTRGIIKFAKKDPKKFAWKMANLLGVSSGIYAYNTNFYKDDYDKVPAYIKATNWVIMTPFTYVDDNGEVQRRYITIPKDHSQMIFTTMFDNANQAAHGHEVNTEQSKIAIDNALSVIPEAVGTPLGRAAIGYRSNLDNYRNRKIWTAEDWAGEIKPEEEWVEGRTPEVYKEAGQLFGISPERSKYVAEQYTSSANAYANFLGIGLDAIMKEMTPDEKQVISDKIIKELGMGLMRRTYSDVEMIKKAKEEGIDVNTKRFKERRAFEKEFKKEQLQEAIETQPELRKEWAGSRIENKSEAAAIWEIAGKKNYQLWKRIGFAKSPESAARQFYKVFKDRKDYEEQKTKAKILSEMGSFSQNLGDKFSEYLFFFEAEEEEKEKEMNEISRQTFEESTVDTKLNIIFDCTCLLNEKFDENKIKIEKYKFKLFVLASGGGIIGGFLAIVSKWAFWGG